MATRRGRDGTDEDDVNAVNVAPTDPAAQAAAMRDLEAEFPDAAEGQPTAGVHERSLTPEDLGAPELPEPPNGWRDVTEEVAQPITRTEGRQYERDPETETTDPGPDEIHLIGWDGPIEYLEIRYTPGADGVSAPVDPTWGKKIAQAAIAIVEGPWSGRDNPAEAAPPEPIAVWLLDGGDGFTGDVYATQEGARAAAIDLWVQQEADGAQVTEVQARSNVFGWHTAREGVEQLLVNGVGDYQEIHLAEVKAVADGEVES